MALADTQLGTGLFTGRAVYGSGVFDNLAEDVSDIVSMISPYETPFLNLIGDADKEADNVLHEWLEEEMTPNAIVNSVSVASTTASTAIPIKGGLALFLQKGMVLRGPEAAGGEYMQITAITANTIVVDRAFATTNANSFGASEFLTVISDAAVEGADVLVDISRPRPRLNNIIQLFKKDLIISGTTRAVRMLGGDMDEMDRQIRNRTREALRDLEKASILGRLSGNTIGSSSAVRTMRGLLQMIATNVFTINNTSYTGAYDSTSMQAFETYVNTAIRDAWTQGGTDLDLILCGDGVKQRFDKLNNSRVRVVNEERLYTNQVTRYENTYGNYTVMLDRWMPTHIAAITATPRLKIAPLRGRSFQYEPVAKTGDATKGMVIGEYTLEHRNEVGMAQISFDAMKPAAGQRLIQAP